MGRQWFASSVRGRGVAVKLAPLVFFLGIASVSAEPSPGPGASVPVVDLEWASSPSQLKVGDRLKARLKAPAGVVLSKDMKVQLSAEQDGGFDVSDSIDEVNGEFQITLTALKAGHVDVPPLPVTDATGKEVARTAANSFEVLSVIPKDDPKAKEPEPPKPPVSLGLPLLTLIALGLLALGLIGAAIYALVRWSRERQVPVARIQEPPKPEDEVALAELVQLEKKGYLKSRQFKPHYFAISEILKHYLGKRFDFDAAESTTDELFDFLRENRGLSNSVMQELGELFDKLDVVKFTDTIPEIAEGAELLEQARKIVLITRRPPPVVVSAGQQTNTSGGKNASR